MTKAVVFAAKRAAPYCRLRLENSKHSARPSAYGHHEASDANPTCPLGISANAATAVMTMPPLNMAPMRTLSGKSASLRSMVLLSAKLAPPNKAK